MPVYDRGDESLTYEMAVPLYRYAQITEVDECALFGVKGDWQSDAACGVIWTKQMRDRVSRYLSQAENMIEDQIRYPVIPRYITEDRKDYKINQIVSHGYLREVGVRAEEVIENDAAVVKSSDPSVVTVSGYDLTQLGSLDEVQVFYPDEEWRIYPSEVRQSGSDLIIEIPRCRTVISSEVDNDISGIDYTDDTKFLSTVDVVRVYTDDTDQATLVGKHNCNVLCAANSCQEDSYSACIRIMNKKIGAVEVLPDNPSSCPRYIERAEMNYLAGRWDTPDPVVESAIVRLAHTLMPREPCNCDVIRTIYNDDNDVPRWSTVERHNNPFGISRGAWIAWKFVNSPDIRLHRAGIV